MEEYLSELNQLWLNKNVLREDFFNLIAPIKNFIEFEINFDIANDLYNLLEEK